MCCCLRSTRAQKPHVSLVAIITWGVEAQAWDKGERPRRAGRTAGQWPGHAVRTPGQALPSPSGAAWAR